MNKNTQTEREIYQLVPFTFEGQIIDMVLIDAQPWFIAKNIGKILGLAVINTTLNNFPENETRVLTALACGKKRKMLALNISGLNRLLFLTKKPIANKLNLWLLTEVLLSTSQIKMSLKIEKLENENRLLRELLKKEQSSVIKGYYLTEEEKNIIVNFRKIENLSFNEIGRITGRSDETVRRVIKEAE